MSANTSYEIAEKAFFSGGLANRLFYKTSLLKRALVGVGIAWLPLAILSAVQGLAWGTQVKVPFFYATGTLVRFLISLPLLIFAEKIIGRGVVAVVNYLETSGIIREDDKGRFHKTIRSTGKLLQSIWPECIILVFIFLTARIVPDIQMKFSPGVTHWGQNPVTGSISFAGVWYKFISHPLYKFLLLRWLWRYGVWTYFLFRVSRLRLTLTASHPDLAGGLVFLGINQTRFGILAFALSAQMSGYIARRVLFEGIAVQSYQYLILGIIACQVLFFILPLFIFSPQLVASKIKGFITYGAFAEKYTDLFEKKWLAKDVKSIDNVLGTSDIQSLADLGNSYAFVRGMRPYPFMMRNMLFSLGLASVAPFLPLMLFVVRLDVLLKEVLMLVF